MTVHSGMMAHRRAAAVRRFSILAAGATALAVLSTGVAEGDYARFLIGAVAFNSITILSISILAGASGVWSLGHTAFIAIGAYMSWWAASPSSPAATRA